MVINDLDILSTTAFESETDAPLIVDSDAVLPCPIACQKLQPVTRRHAKKVQRRNSMYLLQFPDGYLFDVCKAGDPTPLKQRLRVATKERSDDAKY